MKKFLLFLILIVPLFTVSAQQIRLKKGTVTDGIKVNDSLSESFAVYLPTSFDPSQKWPVVFVFDMEGRGKQVLSMMLKVAEESGYLLAASNAIKDSLSVSENILISKRMVDGVLSLFPIHAQRMYTAGFAEGARFAGLVPVFLKQMTGVVSCGSSFPNTEILSKRSPFHYIGIVGTEDFSYPDMVAQEGEFNRLNFPNNLLIFEGGNQWPPQEYLSMALEFFTLQAMAKGRVPKDSIFIKKAFRKNLNQVNKWTSLKKPILALELLEELESTYRPLKDLDSLVPSKKALKRSKFFRSESRERNAVFLRESLVKEDYSYYLEEDILTYNFNNLGWWKYQMDELKKLDKSQKASERQMGKRLGGFVNALIEDNIDVVMANESVDKGALGFLYMLKTITDPKDYEYYKKVISLSSEIEDYGTALFYLEELLKQGYTDKKELYTLENTALLRISPQFNTLLEKYLNESRYEIAPEN
ncbi:MAG: alpha/beta hydrolase [Bacteroidota bacterium]